MLIVILLGVATLIFLYIWFGKKRNERVLNELNSILDDVREGLGAINRMSTNVNANERQAVSRDNALRSLISTNQLILENGISKYSKSNERQIVVLSERVVNEIQNRTELIQNSIHQSQVGISKSFKTKLNEVNAELTEIQQNMRDVKDEILRTQAQSFYAIESKCSNISTEERAYLDKQFRSIHNDNASLDKSVKEVADVMRIHLDSLKPLEELFSRLNTLYNKLLSLDKDILNQEKSLNSMVEKHVKILEYTKELQKTSKDIFDMMKLVLMESIIKDTSKLRNTK